MGNTLGQCIYHNVQSSLNLTISTISLQRRDLDSSGGTQRLDVFL